MHCVLQPSLYSSSGAATSGPNSSTTMDFNGFSQSMALGNSCSSGGGSGSDDRSASSRDDEHDHTSTNSPSPTLSNSSFSIPSPSPTSKTSLMPVQQQMQMNLPNLPMPLPLVPSPTSLSFSSHFSTLHTSSTSARAQSSNYALKPLTLYPDDAAANGLGAAAAAAAGLMSPNETLLPIECGPNSAILYLSKLCQGSKGRCIAYNGYWLTPNQFQNICGRETAKDWKRSIRHNGKSLKLLISKGVLRVHSPICDCSNQGHVHQHRHRNQLYGKIVQQQARRRLLMGLANRRKNMELMTKSSSLKQALKQTHSNNRNYSFAQQLQIQNLHNGMHQLQQLAMNEAQDEDEDPNQMQMRSSPSPSPRHGHSQHNNAIAGAGAGAAAVGSVKRETRLTSIIDHLLISRANEEYRTSSSCASSSSSSSSDQLSEASSSSATSPSASAAAASSSGLKSSGGCLSGGGCGYDMKTTAIASGMEVTMTTDSYEYQGDQDDDEDEVEEMSCSMMADASNEAVAVAAGGGSEPSSLTSTCRDRECESSSASSIAATTSMSPKTNCHSLSGSRAASSDSVDEDQAGEKQSQSLSASMTSATGNPNSKSSSKSAKKRAAIKNERQSPESVRSSPSPTETNNNNTPSSGSGKSGAGADGGPPSPPLKQMEQMMSRNYSDFMRSLAAKYNNANPNDLYPAARSSSFAFDTRFLKPGAAAAAASLLAFQQQQQAQADKIPFPLIDMSSTQTLLSMVRSAAVAAANNSPTHGSSSNSRTTPNGGSTSLPTTPPILAGSGLKRPSSPLDLSSAAGGATGSLLMGNPLGSAAAASLFLNQSAAAQSLLSLPKKSKQAKRCGSACSGCSSEAESISSWTIDDVCSFVSSIDLCAEYVQAFRDHSIDGTSLPLLTEEHLIQNMNMKLGPALKFKSTIAKKLGNCPVCVHCIHCHVSPDAK